MAYDDEIFEGDDSDVFGKSETESSSNTQYTIGNRNVPGYLRSALERYIRENPQIQESFQNFRDPTVLSQFISIYAIFQESLQHLHPSRPKGHISHLRALIEVLDIQHDGIIQRLSNAYDKEYELQMLHSNYISVSHLHAAIVDSSSTPTDVSDLMVQYLSSMAEILSFSIKRIGEKYVDACALADINPDANILEYGIKSEGDFSYAVTNSQPQLAFHYKYGDVSAIGAAHEESFRTTITRFLLPLIFADEKLAGEVLSEYSQTVD